MADHDETSIRVDAAIDLSIARVELVVVDHPQADEHVFQREDVYWIDLCLTPRRPKAQARFIDRWGPHRMTELGSIMAIPPFEQVLLKNTGGRHASVICQLRAEALAKWLPQNHEWTDRQLEACLHITSTSIGSMLLRLNQELRYPTIGSRDMCEALLCEISIELARYIVSVNEPPEKGGLASWRLRLIDARIAEAREPPTVAELAKICKLSTRQLTRAFRVSRSCSVNEYLAQVRIEIAKRRLASGEGVKEIANGLGYATQSAFTFAFRRATGTTPGQYQKSFGSKRSRKLLYRHC